MAATIEEKYSLIVADAAGDFPIGQKSAKILEFAVGRAGEPYYTLPASAEMVLVMGDDVTESGGGFEVYCRGQLLSGTTQKELASEYIRLRQVNRFTIKIASTNSKKPIRLNGGVVPASYGNLLPAYTSESGSILWAPIHIAFSCLDYDPRYVGKMFFPEAKDIAFNGDKTLHQTFADIGKLMDDICAIYKKLLRNFNYLGNKLYLLTRDANRDMYLLASDVRLNHLDQYLALLDECIVGFFALLFGKPDGSQISLQALPQKIADAKISAMNLKSKTKIDPVLDRRVKDILISAKKAECHRYLRDHRNRRISHFDSRFISSEQKMTESVLTITEDFLSQVITYGWRAALSDIEDHITHCFQAIRYIEECLKTVAAGCEIFYAYPTRSYRDIDSYARHCAIWDMYDLLPKEKFDIPWAAQGIPIPS